MCWIWYLVSVVGGIPITLAWTLLLDWLVEQHVPKSPKDLALEKELQEPEPSNGRWFPILGRRVLLLPILIGIFERAIVTTLIIYQVSGTGSFIGAWIAIKSAGGWQRWSLGTRYARSVFFVGLLGSAMSMLIALISGIHCLRVHRIIQISE